MTSDVLHWCDPKWHEGGKTPADFVIMPVIRNADQIRPFPNGFACCEEHAGKVLKLMFQFYQNATVRNVARQYRKTD